MNHLIDEFTQRKWQISTTDNDSVTFMKNNEMFFTIKGNIISENSDIKMVVSFPLKNSDYNFSTTFYDYYDMYDYVCDKLIYLDQ